MAGVPLSSLDWTRGAPGIFRSSELVERGFCSDCGTPLSFRFLDRDRISVSLGSLDDPTRVKPSTQLGIESRLLLVDEIHDLPGAPTAEDGPHERLARLASRQHPDRDT